MKHEVLREEVTRLHQETVRYRDQVSRMGAWNSSILLGAIFVCLQAPADTRPLIHDFRWWITLVALLVAAYLVFRVLHVDARMQKTRIRYSAAKIALGLPPLGEAGWVGRLWAWGAVMIELVLLVALVRLAFTLPSAGASVAP